MSDEWGHYFASIGEHSASIVFDDGISSVIRTIPQNYSLLITVNMLESRDDGLATDAEADRLEKIQGIFDTITEQFDGAPLGRVTYNKTRHHFYQVHSDTDAMTEHLKKQAKTLGYDIACGYTSDPDKDVYFKHLYPNTDDRRVMADMSVISSLVKHGDDLSAVRPIEHWTYFKKKEAAETYKTWAENEGFYDCSIEAKGRFFKKTYEVKSKFDSQANIKAISDQTLAQMRKAQDLDGDYDGWETMVMKTEK